MIVLVGFGLAAVAVLALVFFLGRTVRESRRLQEASTARDVIYEQVRGILASQGVLKMAARLGASAGNEELARCVLHPSAAAP